MDKTINSNLSKKALLDKNEFYNKVKKLIQDENIYNVVYGFSNPVASILLRYFDKETKVILNQGFKNFKLCDKFKININNVLTKKLYNIVDLLKIANNNLLIKTKKNKLPQIITYARKDLTRNLAQYISYKNKEKDIKLQIDSISNAYTKIWEILSTFNLISQSSDKTSLKIFHICEAPGQMVLATQHYVKTRCKNINSRKYDWRANSLNPNNQDIQDSFGDVFGDKYDVIKNNPKKWIWGADNTGDITNVENIKWYRNYIRENWLTDVEEKLDLITADGGIDTENDLLLLQKLDLSQAIMVLSCSNYGGSCIVKHFLPYMYSNLDSIYGEGFFIGYLYLYYLAFEEVILYKPYTSNYGSGEFYVIGKGFKGIDEKDLERLYEILTNFKTNSAIISRENIPESFIYQVNKFAEDVMLLMYKYKVKSLLLLTCNENKNSKNKVKEEMKCETFLDDKNIQTLLKPRFNIWLKKFKYY